MTEERTCPYCAAGAKIYKNGFKSGNQSYRCCSCGRSFQLQYRRVSRAPGIDERITQHYMEGMNQTEIGNATGASARHIRHVIRLLRGRQTGQVCPTCLGDRIGYFGRSTNGQRQRYICKSCGRTFTEKPADCGGIAQI